MELRTHARILKQSKWFILVFTVLVAVAAFVFSIARPVTYKAVVSFDVNFVNRPEVTDYQYGAYYEVKAAEIFTQHLMSWFKTPAVVAEVYDAAGQGYEIESISRFTNRFTAKQYSAQNFAVIFSDRNRDSAQGLAEAVVTVVEKRGAKSGSINDKAVYEIKGMKPVIAESEFNIWLVTAIGAMAGAILSLILVYLREYFRS